MWRRWKAGESLHEIGRAFGKGHGSIRFLLTQRGGIVPAARRRSLRTLTLAERERGRLAPGYAADLAVLEHDPLTAPLEAVAEQTARLTMVGGEVVWNDA